MAEHEKITMAQAFNQALRDAMTADESVLVFGEDVGALGGVFRVTDGLTAEFGDARCFDTPLAESGIVGMAVGLAMNGMRPVVEMQFDAFAYPGVRADRQPRRQDAQPHPRRRRPCRSRSASRTPAASAVSSTTATRRRPTTSTRPA